MKRIILTTIVLFAVAMASMAQSWQKFNYQGVARDATGEVLDNQAIGVQFTLRSGTMAGPIVYQETHSTTTNEFGLFDLQIGGGTVVAGDFSTIDWGADNHFVQTEMDAAGGTSYSDMGTSELLSVPYAMYAADAGVTGATGPTGPMGPAGSANISGDANYLVKFTGADMGENSNVYETSLGYIGIGTTTPGRHLQVSNDAVGTTYLQINNQTTGLGGGDGMSIGVEPDGGAHLWQWESNYLKIGTSNNEKMRIAADGKVGIGTTSPQATFHVNATGSELARFEGSANSKWIGIYTGTGREGMIWSSGNDIRLQNDNTTGLLQLNTNGFNPRITIDGAGYVGVNTTNPTDVFHVKQIDANQAIQMEHQSSGNSWTIGVGTTTQNFRWEYNGTGKAQIANSDGTYSTISDKRLKTDIQEMESVLADVKNMRPTTYFFKDGDRSKRSIGFISQDVQQLFPELVTEDDEGYLWLSYSNFGVIAIKAIQEQQVLIEQLQAEIELLKNK